MTAAFDTPIRITIVSANGMAAGPPETERPGTDAGAGRHGQSGRHARHDLERDTGGFERDRFFGAAPEQEGIAALEPDHTFTASRGGHQPMLDVVLRRCRAVSDLADIHQARAAPA